MTSTSQPRVLKLLSFDGGGVRGLSSILLLKALMTSLNRGRTAKVQPWQEFDLIAGTSTGGLLAIMLGRLRMTVEQCEGAYAELADAIFTPRRHPANIPGKAIDFLKANGRFDEQPLEKILKQKVQEADLDSEELLEDLRSGACKVFVCATQVSDNSPTLIRSYENPRAFGDLADVKIWEAARATSAASTFFDPITIGSHSEKFADGALHHNNPVQLVLQESQEIWPTGDRLLISIGTGSAPGRAIDTSLKDLIDQLARIATETEETARIFLRVHQDMVQGDRLFRFNVYHGLGEISLDESKEMAHVAARTRTYLRDPEVSRKAMACVNVLRENGSTLDARSEGLRSPSPLVAPPPQFIAVQCNQCLRGIYFDDSYFECLSCWFRVCVSCSSEHSGHILQRAKSVRTASSVLGLDTNANCVSCNSKVILGWHCSRCTFSICLTCHLAPGPDFRELRRKVAGLFFDHLQKHIKFITEVPLMICVRGELSFLRSLPPATNGCRCRYDSGLVNHCGSCYIPISLGGDALWSCQDCIDTLGWFAVICDTCNDHEEYKAKHDPTHTPKRYITLHQRENPHAYRNRLAVCAEPGCGKDVLYEATPAHPHTTFYIFVSDSDLKLTQDFQLNFCPANRLRVAKEYLRREAPSGEGSTFNLITSILEI